MKDAGIADCPAPVSPLLGTAFAYGDVVVGTSDVLEQVLDHPVSDEFPQNLTAPVTLS